jgi:branched-chain amino acid transport system substrate-binding protein
VEAFYSLNSKALTKIQSVILIAIIIVAALGGTVAYFFLGGQGQSSETIKIGILADLDAFTGKRVLQSAILAAEHLNAKGGILGREVEIIGEDTDEETARDLTVISSALTRLLTLDEVDFVITSGSGDKAYMIQDLCFEHKKILISFAGSEVNMTQRVIDDYDKCKYYFRYGWGNTTHLASETIDELLHVREITGFNNVGYLVDDHVWNLENRKTLERVLPENGFNLVYKGKFPPVDTFDFSSYFAAAEEAGVEILVPMSIYDSGIPLVKEYHNRQSPMLIYGGAIIRTSSMESWEQTDGKCAYTVNRIQGVTIGYPITNQTLQFHDSYIQKWGEAPSFHGGFTYDIIRFFLSEAIERAGTTETEDVIKALEEIEVETTAARKFTFTSSHDILYQEAMISNPDDYGPIGSLFQWQEDGSLIPIYPKWLMEEAEATITFPDWPGPWDDLN